ncbi:MAG: PrsW family glutamic-type intramembrane protease, partial [Anaerolineae bacterium]|nr:PrsW family glutamic-type intramembrane protease [Anaerolineae bacterium]
MAVQAVGAIGLAAIGAVIATGIYVLLGWWLDRYEKEPVHLIGAALFWGSLPAMVLTALIRPTLLALSEGMFPGPTGPIWGNALLLPAAEEMAKGLFLLGLFLLYRREIDSLYDGFFYGSLVGFGFAFADTVLSAPARQWGIAGAVERTFFLGLAHAFFTGWIGMGFAAARLSRGGLRWAWPILGVAAAIGFHILRDLSLIPAIWNPGLAGLQAAIYGSGILLMIGLVIYGMSRESAWIARYLAEEAHGGVIPTALYETLRSPVGRLIYRWEP